MSRNLLQTLIEASEKACSIARKCRADVSLLALLVQEKTNDESNPRFVRDFKTLADVLIQEAIRHDVGTIFPEIGDSIFGEETSTFTNSLGDSVSVQIGETPEQTMNCLKVVLNGNDVAAGVLAEEVHRKQKCQVAGLFSFPDDFDYTNLGIWIDPIDATAEYIKGDTVFSDFPGITSSGLDCVTVLIGVFDKKTNVPILGVINQPFYKKIDINNYESKIFWGISLANQKCNNIQNVSSKPNKVGIFSSSENRDVMDRVKALGYEIAFSAGAGHKALKVITGEADVYVLSKGSTYKWDTCAPQAILQSLGGILIDFRKSIKNMKPVTIQYSCDGEKCNSGGIIAVRNKALLEDLFKAFSD